ncbi:MAG: UDP-N-acetylmuramoyl-L-alanine--D-glutamate ligase [Clostridia bacterium]|nr:UDP-N-acetylmuramoyl-L-alanine--D-glutamate ligase [Clostridia bacterium]
MKILILGNGKTGKSLKGWFEKQNCTVKIFDDDQSISQVNFVEAVEFCPDRVVLSPSFKKSHPLVQKLRQTSVVLSQLDMFGSLPMVSITGTNGKTTVVSLCNYILTNCNKKCFAVGNFGLPISEVLEKPFDWLICETSSFMLEQSFTPFAPNVSVLTNFDQDHLDFHGSLGQYALAKSLNFINQREDQVAIFNGDDPYFDYFSKQCCSKKLVVSTKRNANCCLDGKVVCFDFNNIRQTAICHWFDNLEKHDQTNYLLSFAVCVLLGATLEECIKYAETFSKPNHRLKKVVTIDNVTFINDSKATNVHATLAALKSVGGKVFLIVGGSDKGEDFSRLFPHVKNVVVCAIGQTANKIANTGKKYQKEVICCQTLDQAVHLGWSVLNSFGGGTVLLSPASASFDMFDSYAQRGEKFEEICKNISK